MMDIAGGQDGKPAQPEEKPIKRKMKSPYQLEVLETSYAAEMYPSETLRAELSAKTGLSDRQLQMWFCHRRLKDRKHAQGKKGAKEEQPLRSPVSGSDMKVAPRSSPMGLISVPFATDGEETRKSFASIGGAELRSSKRCYELPFFPPQLTQLSVMELRVIASVEAQLGESLREDGPILGFEFDPLPPGAFDAPIDSDMPAHSTYGRAASFQFLDRSESSGLSLQMKQLFRPYDGKLVKTSELFPCMDHSFFPSSTGGKRKATFSGAHAVHPPFAPRALQEYQFLPEQPSHSDPYERVPHSHFYDSPIVTTSSRISSFHTGSQFLHGNNQVAPTCIFQGQASSSGLLSPQAREHFHTNGHDSASNISPFGNSTADSQIGIHQAMGMEQTILSSDRTIQDNLNKTERKLKSEARIAREVEAHEKRIRRELEKQDALRRKREEQMRREMEKVDHERRKEEDRMLREKQREEERFLREQKRESERREKILLKESRRAEKLRQKEELQREKEAARLKAANERATARKISREYMELIEDERLELMELAALSKGLSSVILLDNDTLTQLDLFRDQLNAFPPKSVKLKKPFHFQPWIQSEENVGKLLMVWKFLVTFTDVLGLWSFTLDEFLQSLHDYDSRLLGEIHVAVLRTIIRDIEDVARAPANTQRANYTAANPIGGHSQIVEGAYAWGFSISKWQRHLNYLTWPEILRQLALSAGFGPQLKKRPVERTNSRDDEGDDREYIISTLRNGAAAETAAALMQTKSYSHRRGRRHRLTPGTVKFAAFHVLSLEGSKGLTILEVAEKIQKSGLRDLTTSKTPEASIAAALSRDTELFERTAPSTYCVRPAFRKNPTDAEAVLAAARKKMPAFQSGFSDSDEVDRDADNGERDEDSEWEGGDDLEVQDCNEDAKLIMNASNQNKSKGFFVNNFVNNGKEGVLYDDLVQTSQSCKDVNKDFQVDAAVLSSQTILSSAVSSGKISLSYIGEKTADSEDAEIDESDFGELWVQGLTEGDYTDLSVEERLNALVALIGVANEGNSIRVILEERLEAATALKKQMWAEAQLDKRRYKEDCSNKSQFCAFPVFKSESAHAIVGPNGYQTPLQLPHSKNSDDNPELASNSDKFTILHNLNNLDLVPSEKNILGQEFSTNPETFPLQQYGIAAEKTRFELKSFIGHKAEQLYVYRSLPLGEDRRKNKYWLFSTSASPNDPGSGRIFFESRDGFWRLLDSEETFDALLVSLDTRGIRESHLHLMLQRIESTFKEAVRRNKKCSTSASINEFSFKRGVIELISSPNFIADYDSPSSTLCGLTSDIVEYSTSFSVDLGQSKMERTAALKRYRGFVKWMWKECCNPHILCALKYGKKRSSELLQTCQICYTSYFTEEKHCTSCHGTFKPIYNGDAMFTKHIATCVEKRKKVGLDSESQLPDSSLSIGACLLKAQLSLIEVSIPAEALQPFWTEDYRKSWGVKLNLASSADEFLQLLTLFEGAIKQDYLSSKFETTTELLSSAKAFTQADDALISGSVPVLPWIPDTTTAVALRLLEIDASFFYISLPKLEPQREKDSEDFIKLSPRFTVAEAGTSEQVDNHTESRFLDPGSIYRGRGRGSSRGRGRRGRGRRGRGRGGRGSTESGNIREEEIIDNSENTVQKYNRRGRTRGRGRGCGRRSVRPRQRSECHVTSPRATFFTGFGDVGVCNKEDSVEESSRSLGSNEWGIKSRTYIKEDNSSGSHSDGDEQALGVEHDDQVPEYTRHYSASKSKGVMEVDSEDEADRHMEEEDDDGEVAFDDMEATVDDQDEDADDDEEMVDVDDDDDDDDNDEIGADEISDGEEGYGDEIEEGSYSSSGYSD